MCHTIRHAIYFRKAMKINKIESYFCILDAYKPILMVLIVNTIFCDEIFGVIMTLKFWPPCWCP